MNSSQRRYRVIRPGTVTKQPFGAMANQEQNVGYMVNAYSCNRSASPTSAPVKSAPFLWSTEAGPTFSPVDDTHSPLWSRSFTYFRTPKEPSGFEARVLNDSWAADDISGTCRNEPENLFSGHFAVGELLEC